MAVGPPAGRWWGLCSLTPALVGMVELVERPSYFCVTPTQSNSPLRPVLSTLIGSSSRRSYTFKDLTADVGAWA